jgi:hypothetical protein
MRTRTRRLLGLSATVLVGPSSLHGTATGTVAVSCGDCFFNVPVTATLTGAPDVTAPSLLAGDGSAPSGPFDDFQVFTSEPLPATATASAVAGDGSRVALEPLLTKTEPPLVLGFAKPDVVLAPGQGYAIDEGGLVDFAANAGDATAPLRLATFSAAPLVPQDGFESTTGQTGDGAVIVRAGPLAPIAGGASVYLGNAGAPMPGGVPPGTTLLVRLARAPGTTKVTFTYREVMPGATTEFGYAGRVQVGSVGRAVATSGPLPQPKTGTTQTWGAATVSVSDLGTMDLALPADATDEVVFAITATTFDCGPFLTGAGLLVDDLRVE